MRSMIKHSDITVERHRTDGFTLSAFVGGYLVHRRYVGYTVKEAKQMFRAEFEVTKCKLN
jgi:hypothetical protein